MGAVESEQIMRFTNRVTRLAHLERFLLVRSLYTPWSFMVLPVPLFGPLALTTVGRSMGLGSERQGFKSSPHRL